MKCATARSIATLLLALAIEVSTERRDISNYFRLINDVRKYYRASCVIFVLSRSNHDLNTSTLMFSWSRKFSRRQVMTVTVTFADLMSEYNKYRSTIVRPLFVVLLDTGETMSEFAKATSNTKPMSFPIWLVAFLQRPENPLEDRCRHPAGNMFNVDFNTLMLVKCYDRAILTEWYAIRDNRTRMFELATWSSDEGLILRTRKSLRARRCDMFGEMMRVVSVNGSPFFSLRKDRTISGFFGLLLTELSKEMNFTIEMLQPMESYGNWNRQENTWTGVIGQLIAGKADIGAAEFTLMPGRLNVVDFTLPLIHTRSRLYFKQPDSADLHWSGYFQTFSSGIWIMIVTIIITASILLTLMKAGEHFSASLLSENYMRVWGIYCQQSLSEFPNQLSMRLAFLSIYASAFIISSTYSASLISYLAITTTSLPFSTLEDYVKDGSYRLIVMKYSAEYDTFDRIKDPVYLKMYELMEEKHLPLALLEGFKQICEQRNLAFLTSEAVKNALYLPCKVLHIDTGRVDDLAMTLWKDSPYTEFINYHLQRFKDNGIMNKLRKRNRLMIDPPKIYQTVTLEDVVSTLTVVAGGMILAAFIFIAEKAYCSYLFKSIDRSVRKSDRSRHVSKLRGKFQRKLNAKFRARRNELWKIN